MANYFKYKLIQKRTSQKNKQQKFLLLSQINQIKIQIYNNMRPLIRKELISVFCSGTGLVFSFTFLIATGLMTWLFSGSFNIPDAGYASLEKFFSLASVLFIVLIPALTMKLFAEEKKSRTLDLLYARPVSISAIWFSKWVTTFLFIFLVILSTVIYVYTIYTTGNPKGSLDGNVVLISYASLIILSAIFICSGIFASSLTGNQIIAFIIALAINFFIYYGFDLTGILFLSGKQQLFITSYGLNYHMQEMQKGIVGLNSISLFIFYFALFYSLSIYSLGFRNRISVRQKFIPVVIIFISLIINYAFPYSAIDFTEDKRYTISNYSKKLMSEIKDSDTENIQINIYLEGNLNAGFQRLRNSVEQFLSDINKYSDNKLDIRFIDPVTLPVSRDKLPQYMSGLGMSGIILNEVDRDGKLSQQLIYPYSQIIVSSQDESDTIVISLLKNIPGISAEEKLNASIENIEFQFMDALSILLKKEEQHIAFIEGHNELPRVSVYDAEEILSKYYFINRGEIGNNISELDNFKVVIIAGPTQKFSEKEKYILDQYLMKGGRILWLIDGVYISYTDLTNQGQSASIKNEINLDDLLFNYGIRIEPNLLQDTRSTSIIVETGKESQQVTIPWYYSILLMPSLEHIITKNITDVKAEFTSSVALVNKKPDATSHVLLTTGMHSHTVSVPEIIDFDIQKIQSDPHYFNDSFLPVAVSLEGVFNSAFLNRPMPDSIYSSGYKASNKSKHTKMVVASSSNIIQNEIAGHGSNTQVLPMGFDRISGQQYGNREFIINAVKWLANDDLMWLRSKSQKLNLLDKQKIYENRNKYVFLNIFIPLLFIGCITAYVNIRRRLKYTK